MSDREDDRDQDVEDLFGDLDEFFAPIDDVEWPEGEESGEEVGAPTEAGEEDAEQEWVPEIELPEGELLAESEEAGPGSEEPAAEQEMAAAAPEIEEDEEPDVSDFFGEDDEVAETPPAEAEDESPAATEEGSPPEAEGATEEPGDAEPARAAEGTAEMSGEEWERLRSELREDEGEAGEGEPGEAEPVAEEPVLAEEATFDAGEAPPPPAPEDQEREEAAPADVEAAAAHFASGLDADEVERDLLSDLGAEEAGAGAAAAAPAAAGAAEPATGGPAWQEQAYEIPEEGAAPPPPVGARNLTAAVASGAILAAAAIALLAIGKGPFAVLAIGLVLLGQGELYAVLRKHGFQPATALGLIAGAFVMAGAYLKGDTGQGEAAMLFGLVVGTMLSVLWFMASSPGARKGTVRNVAATVFGIAYVPFLMAFALLILAVPGDLGRNLMLTVVGLTVLYDVCAYAVGTLWGSRPLAATISPRKSWEGAIGASLIVVFVALAIVPTLFDELSPAQAAGLALVIAVAAPLGDLAESALKRDLGVKDMGSVLPGHGGILDRFDAILFAAPAAYFYLRLIS